jgi:hypothetical protein
MSMLYAAHEILGQVAAAHAAVLADSSSDSSNNNGILALLLAGPAGGVAYYRMKYRKYRNTDKSDQFERETAVTAKPIEGFDRRVDQVKGTSAKFIKGRNDANYRERVERLPADGPQG